MANNISFKKVVRSAFDFWNIFGANLSWQYTRVGQGKDTTKYIF